MLLFIFYFVMIHQFLYSFILGIHIFSWSLIVSLPGLQLAESLSIYWFPFIPKLLIRLSSLYLWYFLSQFIFKTLNFHGINFTFKVTYSNWRSYLYRLPSELNLYLVIFTRLGILSLLSYFFVCVSGSLYIMLYVRRLNVHCYQGLYLLLILPHLCFEKKFTGV